MSSLIAQSNSFASSLSQVYGGGGRAPAPVVPTSSSSAIAAINQRMQSFAARYAHFDSLTGGPGIASQGPVGAPPLGLGDAQALLTTNAIGLAYDSLQSVDQSESATFSSARPPYSWIPSTGTTAHGSTRTASTTDWRSPGIFQLGTGMPNSPNALVGVGTGTGAKAITVRAQTDILIGSHMWASIMVGGTPAAHRPGVRAFRSAWATYSHRSSRDSW